MKQRADRESLQFFAKSRGVFGSAKSVHKTLERGDRCVDLEHARCQGLRRVLLLPTTRAYTPGLYVQETHCSLSSSSQSLLLQHPQTTSSLSLSFKAPYCFISSLDYTPSPSLQGNRVPHLPYVYKLLHLRLCRTATQTQHRGGKTTQTDIHTNILYYDLLPADTILCF